MCCHLLFDKNQRRDVLAVRSQGTCVLQFSMGEQGWLGQ